MKHSVSTAAPTAWWERLLAVLLWAYFGVQSVLAGYVSLVMPVWAVAMLCARKRRRFIAVHGLRALIAWLLIQLYMAGVVVFASMKGMWLTQLEDLVKRTLPLITRAPALLPALWGTLDPLSRLVVGLLLAGIGAGLLLSLVGMAAALCGARHPRVTPPVPRPADTAR